MIGMKAPQILNELTRRGMKVRRKGRKIWVSPISDMPKFIHKDIEEQYDELLELLAFCKHCDRPKWLCECLPNEEIE